MGRLPSTKRRGSCALGRATAAVSVWGRVREGLCKTLLLPGRA